MDYKQILKQYWGYDDFRGIQREIIESICAGHDTLGLMPTGGGKSITFQVPALAMEGVCIVITPLIALMKDQVQRLRQLGIQAAAVYSGMSRQEIIRTLDNSIFGGLKILYVSPERLSSQLFLTKLRRIHVSFITVDEAHCISQWGYDFRPSYLEIAKIRHLVNPKHKPAETNHVFRVPILALTATATPRVMEDIQLLLQFHDQQVFKMSFERKNLAYVVRQTADKQGQLLHILQAVQGAAIVYTRSRRRTKEIADFLNDNLSAGIATSYHAGLDHSIRDDRQQRWQQGKVRIMVATNAFGMGIDKPDVRLVIHVDCPSSLEAYFQEAGRAGRDGRKSYAVMLYNAGDHRKLEKRVTDTFPEKEYIIKVYEDLAYFYEMAVGDGRGVSRLFDIDLFCRTFHHFPVQADAALTLLSRAGYINYETEPDNSSRVMFLIGRDELYRLNETTPLEEAVITALLRNHGGLFTDYAYIDLKQIAREARLTPDQTYLTLKALTQQRILHFIPQRSLPIITYTQRREASEHIVIPRSIYEDRRKLYAKRIEAVWLYAENDNVCRSRQLLRYFGEERTHDCGQCDVCLHVSSPTVADAPNSSDNIQQAYDTIMQHLGDGKKHPVEELRHLGIPDFQLHAALKYMVSEEIILADHSFIYLAR
ncbi:MAG: RecQ family ATP-dependent DNA helicase [Prevotella sp.]|nr:RecQ family ATP-dependent DNA helicase [Prevotella sp.]